MIRKFFAKTTDKAVAKATSLRNDRKGVALMEYGVLAALICIVCLASLTQVGLDIDGIFSAISTALQAI